MIFIILDILGVFIIYLILFPYFTYSIPKHTFIFTNVSQLYFISAAILLVSLGFFTMTIIKIFPSKNIPAAMVLISSLVSTLIMFASTNSFIGTIYLFALIEAIGLLAGFILTLFVPAMLRDEPNTGKKTYRTFIPILVSVGLMIVFLEFEYYGYLVYVTVTKYQYFLLITWILIQSPVVLKRSVDAYRYYYNNYEVQLDVQRKKLENINQPRNRNLVE